MDKTAVIYARVSTVGQAEEELPVTSQLERCEQKAEELGASVLETFVDDGVSGRQASRPAFQDAVMFAELKQADYFITWSSSRFARNRVDAGFYKRRLQQADVQLVYCSMDVDTSTDPGWLLDSVMEIFDELYSRQVSSDTKRSMIRNAEKGYWCGGVPPIGFRPEPDPDDPKRKRLVPDPVEAKIVEEVFRMRADGVGVRNIAIELNESGRLRRGRKWNKSVVNALLRSQAVIGRTVFGRRAHGSSKAYSRSPEQWTVVDSHQPIIPLELWDRVQALMDTDRENIGVAQTRSSHLFTGLLRCGECGAKLQTQSAKGRNRRYWYYVCRAAVHEKTHLPRRVRAGELDEFLVDLICNEILTKDRLLELLRELREAVASWQKERDERRNAVLQEIRSVERRTSNLYEILELHGKDAPNLGDLTQRLRKNKEQVRELEKQLARIEGEVQPELPITDQDVEELSDTLVGAIKETENPRKTRAFFASFVQQIEVRDEQVVINYDPKKVIGGPVRTSSNWRPGQDSNL